MNNIFRKVLSVFMAAVFCFAVFPSGVFADISSPSIINKIYDGTSEYGTALYHYEDADGNVIDADDSVKLHASSSRLRRSSSIPSSYSSVDEGYSTTPSSQGDASTCWAFTATALLESYAVENMGYDVSTTNFSEAHLVWFSNKKSTDTSDLTYGDGLDSESPYDQGGNWMISSVTLAKGSGVTAESDYPFYPEDLSSMGNYDESARYEHNYGLLDKCEILTTSDAVKQAIIDNGAVGAGYYHDSAYYNSDGVTYVYSSGKRVYSCTKAAYYCDTENTQNHAITIVGWDDDFAVSNFLDSCQPSSAGAWLCKNSWDTNWGLNGYFWLSYEDVNLCDFYTMTMTEDFENVVTYNGAAPWSYYTDNSGATAKVANFFTADSSCNLDGAGFYIETNDMDVTVKAVVNCTSQTNPSSGTVVSSVSTHVNEGYYTVKFPSSVTISAGQRYAIIVEMTPNSDTAVKIPVEGSSYGYGESGTSYFSMGSYSSYWFDCSDYNAGNTFVNAYTSHIHDYAETSRTEGNCITAPTVTSTCSICGKTVTVTDGEPTGIHTEYVSKAAVAPTCTEAGSTEEISCSVCGQVITPSETVPAAHTEAYRVEEDGSGGTGYNKITYCSVCGEVISTTHFDTSIVSTQTDHEYLSGQTDRSMSGVLERILYIIRLIAYTLSMFKTV